MKLIKFLFIAAVSVCLFSSCLKDGKNTLETTEFAFVKKDVATNTVYARTRSYLITSPDVRNMAENTALMLKYKVDRASSSRIIEADFAAADEIFEYQSKLVQSAVPTLLNEVYPSELGYYTAVGTDDLGDRWAFLVSTIMEEGDRLGVYFYYDVNNQKDVLNTETGQMEPLDGNKVIIDVRFAKVDTGGILIKNKNESRRIVGDLSEIRTIKNASNIKGDQDIDKGYNYIKAPVKYRYMVEDDKGQKKLVTVGGWTVNNMLFFTYPRP